MNLPCNRAISAWSSAALVAALLFGMGCGPKYPKCDADKDCHQGEFCVNGLCQQCRADNDCPAGQSCNSGACQPISGFCKSASDCGPGQQCLNNRCVSQTQSKVAPAAPEPISSGGCTLDAVYFDFDSSTLDQASRDKLSQAAACIKQRGITSVQVTGSTDNRGTEEYNLALGDRRSQAAKKYLQSLGVPAQLSATSMGEERASGSDEAGWSRDRRADLQEK